MENLRQNATDEKRAKQEYRSKVVSETICVLENNNFSWISNLGHGTYGTVIEMENRSTKKIMAAKIVMEQNLKASERVIWPSLRHDNVIPVTDCYYLPQQHSWVFLMPKHRTSLTNAIETDMLHLQEKGFQRALSWLEDVLNGLSYLHQQQLCHLDIKPDNVLIDDTDKAVISDLGCLTHTDGGVNTYGAPLIYCRPEAMRSENGQKTIVDGFKFDIYTIGILSIEMFTKHKVIRGAAAHGDPNPNWINVMYPIIFNILKEENFKKYVKTSFLKAGVTSETIRNMRNFITACISINPENRPSVEKALESTLFGGSEVFEKKVNDVWKVRTSPKKLNFLTSLFIGRAAALKLTSDSFTPFQDDNEDKYVTLVSELSNTASNDQDPKPNEDEVDGVDDVDKVPSRNVKSGGPEANGRKQKDDDKVSDDEKIDMNREKDLNEGNGRSETECKPEIVMTRKQKIVDWTRRVKSRVVKSFSRLTSLCRRSRK